MPAESLWLEWDRSRREPDCKQNKWDHSRQTRLQSRRGIKVKVNVLVSQSCSTPCDPRTATLQAPLSVEFSRKQYWSVLPFPSPRNHPYPGIKPGSPALQVIYHLKHQGSLCSLIDLHIFCKFSFYIDAWRCTSNLVDRVYSKMCVIWWNLFIALPPEYNKIS